MPQSSAVELLAPAGDPERMRIAFAYGADAVYAGQAAFSLRGRENGFSNARIVADAVEEAHRLGRKFFLAANVFPHNNKVEAFRRALTEIVEAGPDALIMADPGMIGWMRKTFPDVAVHLSVQAHAVNWATCGFWHDMGVRRVILARELLLREVQEIRERVPALELEVFVHGAVCMAQSGRCMISDWMEHRDANQGNCNNACRFPYELTASSPKLPEGEAIRVTEDEHGTYLFNARDLCALPVLDQVVATGVHSLKIEGRTRSPYYVAQVVRAYRLALDAIAKGEPVPSAALSAIAATDTRGWTSGFRVAGDPLGQILNADREHPPGAVVVGQIRDWNDGRATLSVRNRIETGMRLELLSPEGIQEISASGLENHRGERVDALHCGMEGCRIDLATPPRPWSFLVRAAGG
ncbi:MAG TPA: U32 family peptidase C-terminal domain-containing protein [Fibrobacteria bacterium]|nr:U32 family peptidase C-terminal domain-containing protein [Fibrobacteria bacterium]HOX51893.1 U32 family peptidase C-terminal domain-containing protein [Fibrobacteria bacterium]